MVLFLSTLKRGLAPVQYKILTYIRNVHAGAKYIVYLNVPTTTKKKKFRLSSWHSIIQMIIKVKS